MSNNQGLAAAKTFSQKARDTVPSITYGVSEPDSDFVLVCIYSTY